MTLAHIKGAVAEAEQGTRSIKEGGDDALPHVESFIGRVLNSVHEHVVLLRVPMEIHVEQHLVRARRVGDGGDFSDAFSSSSMGHMHEHSD